MRFKKKRFIGKIKKKLVREVKILSDLLSNAGFNNSITTNYKYAKLLTLKSPSSEALKNKYRKTLVAVEKEIAALVEKEQLRSVGYLYLSYARIAFKLKHWEDAIERYKILLNDKIVSNNTLYFELGKAYLEKSACSYIPSHLKNSCDEKHDHELARICFDQVEGLIKKRKSFLKICKKLDKTIDIDLSGETTSKGIELLQRKEYNEATDVFKKALGYAHLNNYDYNNLISVIGLLISFVQRFDEVFSNNEDDIHSRLDLTKNYLKYGVSIQNEKLPEEKSFKNPGAIFCCGFGWSGSGAVNDFFKQFSQFEITFGGEEVTFYEREYGITSIFDKDLHSPFSLITDLINFILGPVLGLLIPHEVIIPLTSVNTRLWKRDLYIFLLIEILTQLEVLINLISDLINSIKSDNIGSFYFSTFTALKVFSNRVLDVKKRDGKTIVMNNCIFGFNSRLFSLLDDVLVIEVIRDPRDQFVAMYYERSASVSCDEFIMEMSARYSKYKDSLEIPSVSSRVVQVRFEDFILKEDVRNNLLISCGYDPVSMNKVRDVFKPEQSKKNIGLYKKFENQDFIKKIEKAFPDYLYND